MFHIGIYKDPETGRSRWAVLGPGDVWYFPTRYGHRAAERLRDRLNLEAR